MDNLAFDQNNEDNRITNAQPDESRNNEIATNSRTKNKSSLLYSIEETPPWYSCLGFGFQHYLVAIGAIIGLPLIVAPAMCIPDDDEGNVARALLISSLFFVSGICTVLQTTLGVRLPILQGGTFSYLAPTFAILALPHNVCPDPLPPGFNNSSVTLYNDTDGMIVDGTEVWQRRMREIQGAIAVASILQVLLGLSGIIGFILRFTGPLTVGPAVALIGLDLFSVASSYAAPQWGIAMFTSAILILCSQYLSNVMVPLPCFSREKKCYFNKAPLFKMFPVLITLITSWILCVIFTETNVFPNDPKHPSYLARTDVRSKVIKNSPWFYWPYPGQWGLPTVTVAGTIGMLAGVIAGFMESIGDYYACARLCGAPNIPKHALNRGIFMEGFGCMLAGLIGTGTATTSFSENIGAIGITRIGSRRVMQVAGCLFIILGVFSKLGSIFVTIPDPVIGGLFYVTFGMITAVGISSLQYVDMNSPRNLFIIGISLFMGLSVPEWMKANPGIINTPVVEINQILTVLLQTSIIVGGLLAFVFDNTIPGTDEERGIKLWRKFQKPGSDNINETDQKKKEEECYDLPLPTNCCRLSKYIPILPEFGKENEVTTELEEVQSSKL